MAEHHQRTDFDPATHGFHFRNSFNGADILSEITDGFEVVTHLPVPDGFWDRWGLCGGMSWHALDRFYMRNNVPALRAQPGFGSELFRILVARQVDSFRGLGLLGECLKWQTRRDDWVWYDPRPSVGAMTRAKHWPQVRSLIDRGFPASICIIRASGPSNPTNNHQVLAIGYRHDDDSGMVQLELYDPNHPDQRPTINFMLRQRRSRISASQSTGEIVRGFFRWPYDRARRLPRP